MGVAAYQIALADRLVLKRQQQAATDRLADFFQQQAAQLSMRILQRVDVILERRVREAAAAIAMEYANNMAREMQPALEKAVRDAVSEALALEVGAKGLQK